MSPGVMWRVSVPWTTATDEKSEYTAVPSSATGRPADVTCKRPKTVPKAVCWAVATFTRYPVKIPVGATLLTPNAQVPPALRRRSPG